MKRECHSFECQGQVHLKMSLQGTVEHTLVQVVACANNLKSHLKQYRAWSGGLQLGDEQLILPDSDFKTQKCPPVFFKPDVFVQSSQTWMCGDKVSVISFSSHAHWAVPSLLTLATSLLLYLMVMHDLL